MDANNQLYVAGTTQIGSFIPAAEKNQPYIYSLANGASQWTALATAGLTAGPVDSFCLRIGPSPSLTPYLACEFDDDNVQVQSYASRKWTPLTRSTNLEYLSLTADIGLIDVDAKGNIYAVTNQRGPVISQYAGSGQQWNAVGGSFASSTEVAGVSVAGDGTLYAFYRTSSALSQPHVKVYSSGSWSDLGTIAQAPNPVNSMRLAVQSKVDPIFAYTTYDPSTGHNQVFVIQAPTY
jgi:hypothetical protein